MESKKITSILVIFSSIMYTLIIFAWAGIKPPILTIPIDELVDLLISNYTPIIPKIILPIGIVSAYFYTKEKRFTKYILVLFALILIITSIIPLYFSFALEIPACGDYSESDYQIAESTSDVAEDSNVCMYKPDFHPFTEILIIILSGTIIYRLFKIDN